MTDPSKLLDALNSDLASLPEQEQILLLQAACILCRLPGIDIIFRCRSSLYELYPTAQEHASGLSPRQSSLSPALQRALSSVSPEGLGVPQQMDGPDPPAPTSPIPYGPPVPGGPGAAPPTTGFEVPYDLAHRQRPRPPTLPRPAVAGPEPLASLQVPLRPGMEPVDARAHAQQAALEGRDFIRAFSRDFIPVYAEDGVLLGSMPAFGDAVEKVYTRSLQEMDVATLAIRVVRVPYNRGIDPFDIEGFQPAPGVRAGPLSTGPLGPGANRENPDVGRAI